MPNRQLRPEYSNNLEFGINYQTQKFNVQCQVFNLHITNAISRAYGSINGVDSVIFDGELMRIQMNKNISSATINGFNFYGKYKINNPLSVLCVTSIRSVLANTTLSKIV